MVIEAGFLRFATVLVLCPTGQGYQYSIWAPWLLSYETSRIIAAQRRQAYMKSGWSKYDPASKGYTAEEIRKERERYLRG